MQVSPRLASNVNLGRFLRIGRKLIDREIPVAGLENETAPVLGVTLSPLDLHAVTTIVRDLAHSLRRRAASRSSAVLRRDDHFSAWIICPDMDAPLVVDARHALSSATVFDVSMFTQVDGISTGPARNAPTAMSERIDPPPRQGCASPGCGVPQPALDPPPSRRDHHTRDYL